MIEPFPLDDSDPLANYRTIRKEIELYSPQLATKPEFVAVSKSELPGSDEIASRMQAELGVEVVNLSAVTGQGLMQLVSRIALKLADIKAKEKQKAAEETRLEEKPAEERSWALPVTQDSTDA